MAASSPRAGVPSQDAGTLARVALAVALTGAIAGVLTAGALLEPYWRVAVVELSAVGLFALLPGWLYLEFVVHRGERLYDEYVLNLFRLHIDEYRNLPAPPQHTSYYATWKTEHDQLLTASTDNLYRAKFEAVYGPSSVSTRQLWDGTTRWQDVVRTFGPVLAATIVLSLGWSLAFQPELLRDLSTTGGPPFDRPSVPTEPLQYAFIGAYVFILQDLVRRYFRDDLKPSAYVSAVVRIVVVALTVATVHQVWPWDTTSEIAFAFLVGFFPQTGVRLLLATVGRPVARLFPRIGPEHPLSEIDGLSVWYEARLLEEGIEDIENLTTSSLVDVMLRTRMPTNRLVDWLDQAYLYLHLAGDPADRRATRRRLLSLGVRTATDLEAVWRSGRDDPALTAGLAEALDVPTDRAAATVRAILATLEGEANHWHVRQYRSHEWLLRDGRREADPIVLDPREGRTVGQLPARPDVADAPPRRDQPIDPYA